MQPYPAQQTPASGLDFGHIIGDPFSLATVSIAMMAWLITFVSQVISDVDATIEAFPRFAWWTVTYELFCLLGVALVLALGNISKYQIAIVGFLTGGLVFTCSAANTFVYHDKAAMEAAGAGHILLSIIQILWIFYFGTRREERVGLAGMGMAGYADGFGMKDSKYGPGAVGLSARPLSPVYANSHTTSATSQPPQMYTSAQLSGFETSSPVTDHYRHSQTTNMPSASAYGGHYPQHHMGGAGMHGGMGVGMGGMGGDEVLQPTEYPLRAKAVYNYDANPEDVNEISFVKDEILEVSDVSGRWWQARRGNGETGIAPSNYLVLIT